MISTVILRWLGVIRSSLEITYCLIPESRKKEQRFFFLLQILCFVDEATRYGTIGFLDSEILPILKRLEIPNSPLDYTRLTRFEKLPLKTLSTHSDPKSQTESHNYIFERYCISDLHLCKIELIPFCLFLFDCFQKYTAVSLILS